MLVLLQVDVRFQFLASKGLLRCFLIAHRIQTNIIGIPEDYAVFDFFVQVAHPEIIILSQLGPFGPLPELAQFFLSDLGIFAMFGSHSFPDEDTAYSGSFSSHFPEFVPDFFDVFVKMSF